MGTIKTMIFQQSNQVKGALQCPCALERSIEIDALTKDGHLIPKQHRKFPSRPCRNNQEFLNISSLSFHVYILWYIIYIYDYIIYLRIIYIYIYIYYIDYKWQTYQFCVSQFEVAAPALYPALQGWMAYGFTFGFTSADWSFAWPIWISMTEPEMHCRGCYRSTKATTPRRLPWLEPHLLLQQQPLQPRPVVQAPSPTPLLLPSRTIDVWAMFQAKVS